MVSLETSQTPNGKNGRWPSIRLSAAGVAAVSSAVTLVVFVIGFITGALTLKDNVSNLRQDYANLQERIDVLSREAAADRGNVSNRLTAIETESKYANQGIAELKLAIIPKR